MKTFSKLLISVAALCLTTLSVSASNVVPLKYDFAADSLYEYGITSGWSSTLNRTVIDDVRISEEAVHFVLGSNENAINAYITKNFDVPYVAGTLRVSFDVTLGTDSVFSSTYGFPRFSSSTGGVGIINARVNNNGDYILRTNGEYLCYDHPSPLLPYADAKMYPGETYSFDIDFNIDAGTYKIYRDGYGLFIHNYTTYEDTYEFPYTYGELKKLEFGITSCGAQQNVKLDNVSITPLDYSYIYVSGNGNDSGEGTVESPFRTLGKAKEHFLSLADNKKVIILVDSGDYDIPDDITVGEVNIFNDKKIAVYPMNGAVINMTGTDIIIPELSDLEIKDGFVQDAMEKINETYSKDFYQVAPEFENHVTDSGFTVITKNRGSRSYVFQGIMAFYNINNFSDKRNFYDISIPAESRKAVNFAVTEKYPRVKMFLFDSLQSAVPLAPSQEFNGGEGTDE